MAVRYKTFYRSVKYPRLEFRTGQLHLILPYQTKAEAVIKKHKDWINEKTIFIKKSLKAASKRKVITRSEAKFKQIVLSLLAKNAKDLKVGVEKIRFRLMRTKWASCSKRRNLTINTLLRFLPARLIDYIIYHELSHIIEKRHNERFWKIVSKRFHKYEKLEQVLFSYWFLIHKKHWA